MPEEIFEIHASLAESPSIRPESPYHILDWETGWGVLGLNGAIGHEVDGATDVQRPDIGLDWRPYDLLSGHVDCPSSYSSNSQWAFSDSWRATRGTYLETP